jgi:hypothetical protein
MSKRQDGNAFAPTLTLLCGGVGVLTGALIAGSMVLVPPTAAQAKPAYAAATGLPCGKCHVNPAGGGPNTDFGKQFAANGHKL